MTTSCAIQLWGKSSAYDEALHRRRADEFDSLGPPLAAGGLPQHAIVPESSCTQVSATLPTTFSSLFARRAAYLICSNWRIIRFTSESNV
jgi:hypothetical protein